MKTSSAKCRDPGTASPLKLRVARIVASDRAGRLIGALSGNRVRHHGLWFDVRSSDFSPQVRAQMFWGHTRSAETRMIRGLLRGSTAVVELGSSLGVTSAHIAALMAPGGRLVCVEANPGCCQGSAKGFPATPPRCGLTSFMPRSPATAAAPSSPSRPRR